MSMDQSGTARLLFRDAASGRETSCQGRVGQSLLEAGLQAGLSIEHTCGGVGGCSTCHVRVKRGAGLLNGSSDNELDRLDEAPDVGLDSRLACQARITGQGEIVVEIPKWNRNAVRES
jgi:ferredoxin, 2Fe-2S